MKKKTRSPWNLYPSCKTPNALARWDWSKAKARKEEKKKEASGER